MSCSQITAHTKTTHHAGAQAEGRVLHCLWTVYVMEICDKAAACLLVFM